ncbi:MAG: monofunctional biosynthetic peptidoglycan transglycosylase [Kiloniellales bacterium]|nr:monofunctional biosynthetic peptidoglycan transglycosylase [Kiloniellales bacterium]
MPRRRRSLFAQIRDLLLIVAALLVLIPALLILLYRELPPPITPLMLIRLTEGEGLEKRWVPLSEMSRHVARSVLALEDNNFCRHAGVDWAELMAALSDYFRGDSLRGASTITMQTSKNLFLWPGRSVLRKIIEAPLTMMLEAFWSKRRILEVYLNIVEWGPGIYGIEAAARNYFNKSAATLTRREAALLAAVLPNPRRWSPSRPTRYIERRVRLSKRRAVSLGPLLYCTRP